MLSGNLVGVITWFGMDQGDKVLKLLLMHLMIVNVPLKRLLLDWVMERRKEFLGLQLIVKLINVLMHFFMVGK